ncbi:hypothetical protein HU200_064078 [Digitaria exilis]|uniref:F-box domain-containing protein n=1 Tax=Digitaria exilis TaxID=1010633 RepID=A0A835A6D6_9POAL|nr:hypothetical protein HU200_064078 [Digitaria exilis]
MDPARRALPFPDEIVERILVRVASPRELAFASAAHPHFRRIIADAAFLRQYRSLHPPQLLGVLSPWGIMLAEAPHSNAPSARSLALDADFSDNHLPDGGGSNWRRSDARDGRVLVMRSYRRGDSVLPELAVCDPFTRGYRLLPPIPDDLVATVSNDWLDCLLHFEALLVPSGHYEDAHFRVIGWTYDGEKVVAFLYSSLSGTWAAGTPASWDALVTNLNFAVLESDHWLPSYAYGCFYWQVPGHKILLKLNINMMEFSAVGLPPNYHGRHVVVAEAGEGRLGIFSRSYHPTSMPTSLQYYTLQNEDEDANVDETTIPLPTDCQSYGICCGIVNGAEGYIFLLGEPSCGLFTLETKTFKVERLCSAIGCSRSLSYSGYFGQLAMVLGEGISSQTTMEASLTSSLQTMAAVVQRTPPRKLTPKKLM